jgi:hypothetical protein
MYKTDIMKMLNNEADASKKISEDIFLPKLLVCKDSAIFLTLSEHICIYTDDKLLCFSSKLDENDCFVCMDGYKNDFLFGTLKGRVFKGRFNDDVNGLVSFVEIHHEE